jgi:predicted transcriptional regulator
VAPLSGTVPRAPKKPMTGKNIDPVGYVIASRVRREVFVSLSEGPSTPDLLRSRLKVKRERVSLALRHLCDMDLVLRPPADQFHGRVYRISPSGELIAEEVKALDEQYKKFRT